jgi:hypothetical protein
MPGYQHHLLLHIIAGTLALLAFWLAAVLRKGSPNHRLVGRIHLLSMAVVLVTGVPLALQRLLLGHPVTATFLGYLIVLVGTTVWLAWRAIRDRHDPARYFGRVYRALAVANALAGLVVLGVGVRAGQPLLIGFAFVGLFAGFDMWRRRRIIAQQPRWWMREHYGAMVGNGAATHVALLAIGLPRLLPDVSGSALFYAAWFAPVVLAFVAKLRLDRRYRVAMRPACVPAPRVPAAADVRVR